MQGIQQLLGPIPGIFNIFFYEPVYNILMTLYGVFHTFLPSGGFALAIVVLTLMLRACLIPLTRKQLKSSRAMQELQPKLKELQARYKNAPQELMAAQQALYKEHGVNPVSGCLPLLIQMPFIYALYGAFETVIYAKGSLTAILGKINGDLYPFVPHLRAVPDTAFFWTSLARPDSLHILPVVAAILTFLQLRMALPVRKPTPAGQRDSMSQATGMMQYVMPIMTLVIGLGFPAGLALYWCVSTLFSAVQQYFLTGVGSLFVGIPGLEHLVPEPKVITAPTPVKSRPAGSARARTAPPPTGPAAGGLRGMLGRIKEQMSAAQQSALESQKAKQNGTATADTRIATTSATETAAAIPKSDTPKSEPATRRDRPRTQQKTGPVLVKPPASGAHAAKTATGDFSEATPTSIEGESQPDVRVANGAANGNGKNGSSTSPSPDGARETRGNVPAATGARAGAGTAAGRPSGATSNRPNPQRKSPGSSGNKGMQSGRPRPNGRPKGGR